VVEELGDGSADGDAEGGVVSTVRGFAGFELFRFE
jgi:hypothetical protein